MDQRLKPVWQGSAKLHMMGLLVRRAQQGQRDEALMYTAPHFYFYFLCFFPKDNINLMLLKRRFEQPKSLRLGSARKDHHIPWSCPHSTSPAWRSALLLIGGRRYEHMPCEGEWRAHGSRLGGGGEGWVVDSAPHIHTSFHSELSLVLPHPPPLPHFSCRTICHVV